ncbi:MAG: peptidoglycan-binding protein [Candidatus Eremiobacteraeota bacterium]|nr:peptidoglycan-binding protein [Candidatus Eremiobacteraeota bacterium]
MPTVEKIKINGVACLKIIPSATETVVPVLHVGKASEVHRDIPQATALVNGTFFTDRQTAFPEVYGDVLTPVEFAYGFPHRQDQHLDLRGRRFFWSPAHPVAKSGYENRCGLGAVAGKAVIARHQPQSIQEISQFDWFLGGGALLVADGKLANFGNAGPLGLHENSGGSFGTGQTRDARRTACGITPAGIVHFIVAKSPIGVNSLAHGMKSLGYVHAVMFDGGGATTAGWKENGRFEFSANLNHAGYPRLASMLAMIEAREVAPFALDPHAAPASLAAEDALPTLAAAAAVPPGWPVPRLGDKDPAVLSIQLLLQHQGASGSLSGTWDTSTQQKVSAFQTSRGLPVTGQMDAATFEALIAKIAPKEKNSAVQAMQNLLVHWHSFDLGDSGPKGDGVDGDFGKRTQAAITRLQLRINRTPGSVDLVTWRSAFGPSTLAPFDRVSLAKAILANTSISLAKVHPSGVRDQAFAKTQIEDTAAGKAAKRSSYGTAPGGTVLLNLRMLAAMLRLVVDHGFRYHVSEIAGGSHSRNSFHYEGGTIDVSVINGSSVISGNSPSVAFRNAGRELGAVEILGPGNAQHDDHVHLSWGS